MRSRIAPSRISTEGAIFVDIPWTDELSRIAEIVRGHHEKLDGTGFTVRLNPRQCSTVAANARSRLGRTIS